MKLNTTLLNLIIYIQKTKESEAALSLLLNEEFRTRDYNVFNIVETKYFKLPKEIFVSAGIKRSRENFEMILSFPVTQEMLNVQEDELSRFEVPFKARSDANFVSEKVSNSHVFLEENLENGDGHRPWVNNCVEDSFG